jgi:hypothetical protein
VSPRNQFIKRERPEGWLILDECEGSSKAYKELGNFFFKTFGHGSGVMQAELKNRRLTIQRMESTQDELCLPPCNEFRNEKKRQQAETSVKGRANNGMRQQYQS